MPDIINDYNKNGYKVLKKIIPNTRIDALLENICKLYCKYSKDSELESLECPWKSKLFHKKLIEFREKEPLLFGAIYDSLKTSITLTQLVSNDTIVDNVAKFLNVKPSEISISEPMCRLDVPNDKVWLMPEGLVEEELNKRRRWLMELCQNYGYNFSDRLHIIAYGDKRGV